jgi:hypothetical protein
MVRHVERKALQIHNLYVVVIKGTKITSTAYTQLSLSMATVWKTFMIFRTHTCHFHSNLLKESDSNPKE